VNDVLNRNKIKHIPKLYMAGYRYKRKPARMVRRKKSTYTGPAAVGPSSYTSPTQAVTQLVRRIVSGTLEKKFVSNATQAANFNSSIAVIGDMKALVPQVTSGTGSWQRLDQRITPIRLNTTWHFSFSDTINRSMNILVSLYCFHKKNVKYVPDMAQDVTTNGIQLLAAGNSGIVQPFNGYVTETDLPLNKDSYVLIKKYTFQLTNNVGLPNGDTTAGNAPNVGLAASHKKISLTIPTPKQLTYKPTTGIVYPDGFAPFWAVGYAHVGGAGPDAFNTDLNVSWNTTMTYTDA